MRLLATAAVAVLGLGAAWWNFAERVQAGERNESRLPSALRGMLPDEARDDHLFEAWLGDEIVLGRSPELEGSALPRFAGEPGVPVFEDFELPDGRTARAVAVRYLPPAPPDHAPLLGGLGAHGEAATEDTDTADHAVEVVVAKPTAELDATLRHLRWLLGLSWAVTTLVSAAGLAWLVRRGLAPLARLGDQIQAKDEGDLREPFDVPDAPDELQPVVERLNGFRERVGDAIEREHAFAAHAAHEFRTPLAGLRSTLEVSLSRAREPEEYRASEEASLEITLQLERLVGRLLELSRTPSPSTPLNREPVALRALVLESWSPYSDAAAERGVRLDVAIPADLEVSTDRQLLGRVVQNLLENAGNYADEDSVATVTVRPGTAFVEVVFENRRTGVDPEVAERAFDPFWRSDSARTAAGRHAGLGLALSAEFVERLGGTIALLAADDRFRATVRLER